MRRIVIALAAAALIVASLGTGALASNDPCARADVCLRVTFPETTPSAYGRVWTDSSGMHGRDILVSNTITDTASDAEVGTLAYSFNFNASADFSSSEAWCSFTLSLDSYGTFDGHCNGSLVVGHLEGAGGGGSTLEGTYTFDSGAPGAILGQGPYDLEVGLNLH
jgi:hypothetical protein